MNSALDILIVGCGRIAGSIKRTGVGGAPVTHAEVITAHPAFTLAGAVDPNQGALDHFVRQWQVPAGYSSLAQAITERQWDGIVLAAPDDTHFVDLMTCLDSSAADIVIVEKPLCMNAGELAKLEQLEVRTPVAVNHSRRFERGHRETAKLIRKGVLGELVSGSAHYYGGWIHSGVHMVDTLRMFFGDAVRINDIRPAAHERPGDPTYDVDFTVGTAPVVLRGFKEAHFQIFELDLRFSKGRVRLNDFGEDIVIETVSSNTKGERVLVPLEHFAPGRRPSSMEQIYEDAASFLLGGTDTPFTGAGLPEAIETMKLLFSTNKGL